MRRFQTSTRIQPSPIAISDPSGVNEGRPAMHPVSVAPGQSRLTARPTGRSTRPQLLPSTYAAAIVPSGATPCASIRGTVTAASRRPVRPSISITRGRLGARVQVGEPAERRRRREARGAVVEDAAGGETREPAQDASGVVDDLASAPEQHEVLAVGGEVDGRFGWRLQPGPFGALRREDPQQAVERQRSRASCRRPRSRGRRMRSCCCSSRARRDVPWPFRAPPPPRRCSRRPRAGRPATPARDSPTHRQVRSPSSAPTVCAGRSPMSRRPVRCLRRSTSSPSRTRSARPLRRAGRRPRRCAAERRAAPSSAHRCGRRAP